MDYWLDTRMVRMMEEGKWYTSEVYEGATEVTEDVSGSRV